MFPIAAACCRFASVTRPAVVSVLALLVSLVLINVGIAVPTTSG